MAKSSWYKDKKETKIIINGEEWVPESLLTSYHSSYETSQSENAMFKCLGDVRILLDGNLPEEIIGKIENIILRHFS